MSKPITRLIVEDDRNVGDSLIVMRNYTSTVGMSRWAVAFCCFFLRQSGTPSWVSFTFWPICSIRISSGSQLTRRKLREIEREMLINDSRLLRNGMECDGKGKKRLQGTSGRGARSKPSVGNFNASKMPSPEIIHARPLDPLTALSRIYRTTGRIGL